MVLCLIRHQPKLVPVSVYVSVRGWVECDRDQLESVKRIIAENSGNDYSGGWAFPMRPFNWTSYVFYGGDLQEGDVSWLRDQLMEIAALPSSGEDSSSVQGLFMVTHEVAGLAEWQIRDGSMHVGLGSDRHQYLGPF